MWPRSSLNSFDTAAMAPRRTPELAGPTPLRLAGSLDSRVPLEFDWALGANGHGARMGTAMADLPRPLPGRR